MSYWILNTPLLLVYYKQQNDLNFAISQVAITMHDIWFANLMRNYFDLDKFYDIFGNFYDISDNAVVRNETFRDNQIIIIIIIN